MDRSGGIRHTAAGEHLVCSRIAGSCFSPSALAHLPVQVSCFGVGGLRAAADLHPSHLPQDLFFGIKDTNNQEIGRIAVVIQEVDPVKNTGRVRLDGVD